MFFSKKLQNMERRIDKLEMGIRADKNCAAGVHVYELKDYGFSRDAFRKCKHCDAVIYLVEKKGRVACPTRFYI